MAGVPSFSPLIVDDSYACFTPVAGTFSEPSAPRRPEHALMQAVLERTLDDLKGCGDLLHNRHAALIREAAKDWFCDDHREWAFSFLSICDALHLDASAVRKRLAAGLAPRH